MTTKRAIMVCFSFRQLHLLLSMRKASATVLEKVKSLTLLELREIAWGARGVG
jgi:hypothetical protein